MTLMSEKELFKKIRNAKNGLIIYLNESICTSLLCDNCIGDLIAQQSDVIDAPVAESIRLMRPLLPEESAQISESAVLDDDAQFTTGNPLNAGAEQIDNVQMRAEVTKNFQFANKRFD